jgi:hypothetical protein
LLVLLPETVLVVSVSVPELEMPLPPPGALLPETELLVSVTVPVP